MTTVMLAILVPTAAGRGPRAADVAGAWEGTWTSADKESTGTFRVVGDQRGKVIRGTITLSLDWLPQARIEGLVGAATLVPRARPAHGSADACRACETWSPLRRAA